MCFYYRGISPVYKEEAAGLRQEVCEEGQVYGG